MVGDPLLEALARTEDERGRQSEVEHLVVTIARPLIDRILGRYMRSERILQPHDADDVASTVMLRLVAKLSAVGCAEEEPIESLPNYVATLTFNAVYDALRQRFPQHTRLKNRLRYLLQHEPRLSLWWSPHGLICGLRGWRDEPIGSARDFHRGAAAAATYDQRKPADAVVAIFEAVRRPLTLDDLAEVAAQLWGVADRPFLSEVAMADRRQSSLMASERRELLMSLWREIQLLRPLQRKALLLNLRDGEAANVLALFVLTEIVAFDDLARALDITPPELKAMWDELPLADSRIAEMLHVTRQQVINLRKSARERLTRRLHEGKR